MNGKKDFADCLRPEILAALEQFPPVTYDPEGIAAQRAGGEFLKQHPEFLPTDPEVCIRVIEFSASDGTPLRLRIKQIETEPPLRNVDQGSRPFLQKPTLNADR